MIWTFSWISVVPDKSIRGCFTRRYWRCHMLLIIIPPWLDNWKTETIYPNGKLHEHFQ